MKKRTPKPNDAIFLITEERGCPIYNAGEELKVESFCLTVPSFKTDCLYLAQSIISVITSRETFSGLTKFSSQKTKFDCSGGCGEGIIRFEFKKEKDFATLQMKLLSETEERRRRQHLDRFFGVLRNLDLFESLDDDALIDLTMLLEMKTIPVDKVVLKKGDPGTYLHIILNGRVAVIAEDGSRITEMGVGAVFGEMSLLSGEPVSNSIHTIEDSQLASLSVKNFKHVLKKYPVLQLFLLKLLVDRAQAMTLRSGNITSGMSGELAEISMVDLFQLINSSQKTGTVQLILDEGKAAVLFNEGEIVYARYLELRNKDALFALLNIKSGRFTYTKGIPSEFAGLEAIGGFMGLLMEGLQKIDEDLG